MRVIAGKARRIPLKTVEGMDTRPTTDRIKETLFNMLNPRLYDTWFLDVFSGSGGIAIEALSRGAEHAVLIEKNKAAADCIRANLKSTRLEGQADVMQCDWAAAVDRLEAAGRSFDIIFMDPPYRQDLERQVLSRLADSKLLKEDTLIIVEASLDTEFDWLEPMGYELVKEKNYKTNKHMFIQKL
ncbi:MAG: 16S rRNA (guanine(966)-N(2))-methyltransferase RsmD [Lachnospiraceae bacterium]|nr:16S rRNA (guanine(966)-N(2))-methyltransferase RsmD [Lachnospiraceae bacterium]